MNTFNIKDLQRIFNETFQSKYNTVLIFGADEPFYEAAKNKDDQNKIICRSDFFASALHEIGHWCIAGKERRTQDDFGYWYNPDGRNLEEQTLFEEFEIRPQAIEWAFSLTCKYSFEVSVDNLSLPDYDTSPFKEKVHGQLLKYQEKGLPKRAKDFVRGLNSFYNESLS